LAAGVVAAGVVAAGVVAAGVVAAGVVAAGVVAAGVVAGRGMGAMRALRHDVGAVGAGCGVGGRVACHRSRKAWSMRSGMVAVRA
jgi:hypothetical protein